MNKTQQSIEVSTKALEAFHQVADDMAVGKIRDAIDGLDIAREHYEEALEAYGYMLVDCKGKIRTEHVEACQLIRQMDDLYEEILEAFGVGKY